MHMKFNIFLIILHCSARVNTCRHSIITNKPGQRCVTVNDTNHPVVVDRHQCVLMCMHCPTCRSLNYNFDGGECVLNEQPCLNQESDDHFLAVFFGDAWIEFCLRWVPSTGSVTSAMVPTSSCHHDASLITCYVGRLVSAPHILPGKFYPGAVFSVLDGDKYIIGNKEVLEVTPGCQVSWVSYTAGSAVPFGAVVGGYLANGVGSTLYVIRGLVPTGYTIIGYYDPASERGWGEFEGPQILTLVEMLVLI